MTRWSAITRTRAHRSALAYGSRSTTGAETTSTGSYTTSGDATGERAKLWAQRAKHGCLANSDEIRSQRGSQRRRSLSKGGRTLSNCGRALKRLLPVVFVVLALASPALAAK